MVQHEGQPKETSQPLFAQYLHSPPGIRTLTKTDEKTEALPSGGSIDPWVSFWGTLMHSGTRSSSSFRPSSGTGHQWIEIRLDAARRLALRRHPQSGDRRSECDRWSSGPSLCAVLWQACTYKLHCTNSSLLMPLSGRSSPPLPLPPEMSPC